MPPIFPWSAVLGQERLKLALLLCAIDPGVGGVLVRGPRGVAKTTLARAFAQLLPGRFVELPLGATEERLVGSLDLGKALGSGEVQFSPGLLARAHDGVLYVDEVNLLPDALVDLLLDASASGTNVIERDGISHAHPARFVLVGTMNPEEGELRPQLVDRFGLSVNADAVLTPEERTRIVERRLAFERDPAAFAAAYESEQRALSERCARSRARALVMPFAGPGVARVAELCHAAQVDGVRADLAMLRAARAHAAWHDRESILEADVDAVAELALAHRRRPQRGSSGSGRPSEPHGQQSSGQQNVGRQSFGAQGFGAQGFGAQGFRGQSFGAHGSATTSAGPSVRASHQTSEGERGALPPVQVRARPIAALPEWLFTSAPRGHRLRSPAMQRRRKRGAHALHPGAIDWFRTLIERPAPGPAEVRRRQRRLRRERLWIVTIDCSASMLSSAAAATAKGLAQAIAARAVESGARLGLISFGGTDARRGAVSSAALHEAIDVLEVGGGTPLRRALQLALELEREARSSRAALDTRWFVLTDGRSSERVDDLAARAPLPSICVLDCELGALRLGRARRLAETLGATYTHVEALRRLS